MVKELTQGEEAIKRLYQQMCMATDAAEKEMYRQQLTELIIHSIAPAITSFAYYCSVDDQLGEATEPVMQALDDYCQHCRATSLESFVTERVRAHFQQKARIERRERQLNDWRGLDLVEDQAVFSQSTPVPIGDFAASEEDSMEDLKAAAREIGSSQDMDVTAKLKFVEVFLSVPRDVAFYLLSHIGEIPHGSKKQLKTNFGATDNSFRERNKQRLIAQIEEAKEQKLRNVQSGDTERNAKSS